MRGEEDKWTQLASLETRATSLRRKAVAGRSMERSGTPGVEDHAAKQRSVQIIDKLEYVVSLVSQLEALLRHSISQFLTEGEKAQFALEGLEAVGMDVVTYLAFLHPPLDTSQTWENFSRFGRWSAATSRRGNLQRCVQ